MRIDPKLAGQARTVETFAWIAAVVLGLQALVLLRLLNLIGPAAAGDLRGVLDAFVEMLPRLANLLPAICYFSGVVAAARIFNRIAGGELFSAANAKGLSDVGMSLVYGAVAAAVVVPFIQSLIEEGHPFVGVRAEPETWVLVVIGGAVAVLGRMMRHGMRLQNELDSII